MFSEPRTFVISSGEFDPSHLAIFISAFCMFIYETRRQTGLIVPPVFFVLDDAMSLAFGSLARESEHVARPIVNWLLHARSLNINFCFSVQNFAETSPAIRNNCQTLVCLGATGQDAVELARHMNLTPEQARVIPQLTPGRGIILARGQYPLAVEVFIPMVEL